VFFKRKHAANEDKNLLPVGVAEFHQWSDKIIAQSGLLATPESQKYALANLLTELPPSHHAETDAYFITRLRKHAVNQIAVAMRDKIYSDRKAREDAAQQNPAVVTPPLGANGEVLEVKGV
jgi:hypothetical protein